MCVLTMNLTGCQILHNAPLICQHKSNVINVIVYTVVSKYENYLDILDCFLYQPCQACVCVSVYVSGPVWSQVADHQVEVVPLQPSKPERLADRADLRQTHPSLLELCSLLFQPGDRNRK